MSNQIAVTRDAKETETWSLCWQAAVGRDLFCHPAIVQRIQTRLIAAHERRGRVLIDFIVLPAEIHAISQLRVGDSVAGVARSFGTVVSRWVRRVQPLRSPVLAGPYSAQRLDSDDAVRQEIRMFAWRPVFTGASPKRNYYPNAALRYVLGLKPSRDFETEPMLSYFGDATKAGRKSLTKWLAKPPSVETWRAWEMAKGLKLAIGDDGSGQAAARKVEAAAALLIAAGGGYGVEGALALLAKWVSTKISPSEEIDLHVGNDALAARGRALVAGLAVAHRLCSAATVARYFGKAKATLSERMTRCKAHPADRLILRAAPQRIAEEVAALRRSAATPSGAAERR
ncbi:hypothetical protein SNE35_31690 [Paucibacter sp. R3-3]|uniref:Transposase IS200-like domain-containing protein n=1 Tax=Roseateles agri TaxID=3098619 RepID=A0ABU5DS03_9BURK|nr:hypothetical protein [Paucibacter sp. R3-3]MDY0749102.1 hypothetical protein [Paucibacter sp. R3-3]